MFLAVIIETDVKRKLDTLWICGHCRGFAGRAAADLRAADFYQTDIHKRFFLKPSQDRGLSKKYKYAL